MTKNYIYILTIMVLFLLISCKQAKEERTVEVSAKENNKTLKLKYAKWFTVDYKEGYKSIKVFSPWTKELYWEYHVSEKKIRHNNQEKLSVFTKPSKSIVLSGTQIGMFNKLSILSKITAVSNGNYIYNSIVKERIKQDIIQEVGDGASLNVEKAYLTQSDIIFTTAWDQIAPSYLQLIDQEIPVAFVMDWQEESPLARAEWIKFIAVFFDMEEQAQQIFDSIEQNYMHLVVLAESTKNRPKIIHGTPMSGVWYMAGGKSFAAQYYKDAGADYLWKEDSSTGSIPLSFEAVFSKAESADFWFNSFKYSSIEELLLVDKRYALIQALKKKNVFSNVGATNSDSPSLFWEEGVVNPDLVLKDIISITQPKLIKDYRPIFFRRIN